MEEDIKILEQFAKYNKYYKEIDGRITMTIDLDLKTELDKGIENLLERYKELEEENKQLKTDKALQIQMNKRLIEEGIPISVIKNKINGYLEYDKIYKTHTSGGRENFTMEYFKAQTLKELLEERNK